jgi:beta-carotene 3-hydroxylase
MSLAAKILLVLGSCAFMEFFAWFVHKHVMHGWGWNWHRSHHEPHDEALEKNDLYAVVFAGIVVGLFWIGAAFWEPLWWMALGVTLYGLLYFIVHDGLVHQRWPFRATPRKGYAKRLVQAHKLHHATHGKDGAVSFGFLWAEEPRKLKARLKRMHGRTIEEPAE